MRTIAITGGKGGTGKSTFALMYASKLANEGRKVVLCDADVECPNDYLLSNQELEKEKEVFAKYPEVDEIKCNRCGLCVRECRANALYMIKDKAPALVQSLCTNCALCWRICPTDAIGKRKELVGHTYSSKVSDNLLLVTGRSIPNVIRSAPVVDEAKSRAMNLAKEVNADYLLVDTAAGTHCTVIGSLIGNESAFVVTEPTPLGVHDSGLMLKLLDTLNIQARLVINKYGVSSSKELEKIAAKFDIDIDYKIPYSKDIVEAYAGGKVLDLTLE